MRHTKQRKDPMAKQTTKTTAAKKPAAKTVAKKTTVKKATATVANTMPCGCDKNCACGGHCHEHGHCKCCHGGFWKKLILFVIIFALGFASAKLCCCHAKKKMMPKPEFDNGCLVVKCPKLAKMVPMMDKDNNGCVSATEYKLAQAQMHKPKKARRHQPTQPDMAK